MVEKKKVEWGFDLTGFGKDVAFLVEPQRIPCACGVGDMAVGDEVFKHFLDQVKLSHGEKVYAPSKTSPETIATKFWKHAKRFDASTYDQEKAKHELPEIWCPCAIPRTAIVRKVDKNHPLEVTR